MTKKILLHACCAVCAGHPIEYLIEKDYEPILYFYNPNIHPQEEYDRRLAELVRYCEKKHLELHYICFQKWFPNIILPVPI